MAISLHIIQNKRARYRCPLALRILAQPSFFPNSLFPRLSLCLQPQTFLNLPLLRLLRCLFLHRPDLTETESLAQLARPVWKFEDCSTEAETDVILGLSGFLAASFRLLTKSSNSFCRSSLRSRLFRWSSGLYFWKSCSSVGITHMVNAGPPTQMTAPLVRCQCLVLVGEVGRNVHTLRASSPITSS